MRPAVAAVITAVLSIACFGGLAVHAQNIMRSPSINIQSRVPTISTPSINPPSITPTVVTPRIDPNIAGRAVDIGSGRSIPSIRSACTAAERDSGECSGQVANSAGGGGNGRGSGKNRGNGARGNAVQAALDQRSIANELVADENCPPKKLKAL